MFVFYVFDYSKLFSCSAFIDINKMVNKGFYQLKSGTFKVVFLFYLFNRIFVSLRVKWFSKFLQNNLKVR